MVVMWKTFLKMKLFSWLIRFYKQVYTVIGWISKPISWFIIQDTVEGCVHNLHSCKHHYGRIHNN